MRGLIHKIFIEQIIFKKKITVRLRVQMKFVKTSFKDHSKFLLLSGIVKIAQCSLRSYLKGALTHTISRPTITQIRSLVC